MIFSYDSTLLNESRLPWFRTVENRIFMAFSRHDLITQTFQRISASLSALPFNSFCCPPLLLLVAFRFVAKLLFFVYLIMRQASSTCCCCCCWCCCCLRLGLHISYFIVIATEWFTLSLFLRPRIGTLRSLVGSSVLPVAFVALPPSPVPLRRDPSLRQETATMRGRGAGKTLDISQRHRRLRLRRHWQHCGRSFEKDFMFIASFFCLLKTKRKQKRSGRSTGRACTTWECAVK